MIYKSNGSYPIPKVETKNPYYAHLLMQDYAGVISEETAIHLYLYQFLIQNNEYQALADALHQIAEVEMHHFQLLGETIKLLGVNPVYKTQGANAQAMIPWNADYVNYEKNVKQILEIDINSESTAIRNYQLHREIINDHYIKILLTKIIEDEKIHLNIFREFLDKMNTKY